MKQLLIILCCIIYTPTFSQRTTGEGFIKAFPGNESVIYATNSKYIHGLSFYHRFAKDTLNPVLYIENFKYSDVKVFRDKVKMTYAKVCLPDYKSKPGDLVFTTDEESEIIFYYHMRPEDLVGRKIN